MANTEPIEWNDYYYISKDRKTLTDNELHVPGLRMFGYQSMQTLLVNLPAHYHKDAFEFSFLIKGQFNYSTDSMEYSASGGDVIISYPNEIHSSNDHSMTLHQQYWFQLDISDPDNFLFLNTAAARSLIQQLYDLKKSIIRIDQNEVKALMKQAFLTALSKDSPMFVAASVVLFLQYVISSEASQVIPADIEQAQRYIDAHIRENILLEDVAKYCNLSISRFKQKFAQAIGKSPRSYINIKKIELAKELLLDSHSITDVAIDLGFNNISYFSSVFKKYTLKSPREFVQQHQNEK